jgi:glycosyltransferase involved in cell wall biosynthesis
MRDSAAQMGGKMKILHAISTLSPETGGPAAAVVGMAKAVAALGHDVAIHATDYRSLPAAAPVEESIGPGRLRVFVHRHWPASSLTLQASYALWRALREEIPRADVVHLHSLYLFHDWVTWRECRRASVPYILRPHGSLDPFMYRRHRWRKAIVEQLFQARVTRDATLIHYTSEVERDRAQPFVFGGRGMVVSLGLDVGRFERMPSPECFRARHPELRDRRIILFLGRLSFKKGLELLVPAFAAAAARRPDLHLVLAGPADDYEPCVRALIRQYGLFDRATLTGTLSPSEVLEAYAAANLFVLPSRNENFGIAAAEAMAAGVPTILSNEVQIADQAAREGACRVVPLDAAAWTKAILEVLAEGDEVAARARAHIASHYSWESVGRQLVDMYRQAIESRGSIPAEPHVFDRSAA